MDKIIRNIEKFKKTINIACDSITESFSFKNHCQFHDQYWKNVKLPFDYNNLDIIMRGQSKEIRRINENYVAIKYIPSISSHTYSRFGMLKGTDSLRMDMTIELFTYLQLQNIKTLFVTRCNDFLVFENLSNPPAIEVIFKYFHSGTPVWRYWDIDRIIGRNGTQITLNAPYPIAPIIRFDWRNPANKEFKLPNNSVNKIKNFLKDTVCISKKQDGHYLKVNQDQEPFYKQLLEEHKNDLDEVLYMLLNEKHFMRDETLPEDLADYFINVVKAKKLTHLVATKLKKIFELSGYDLWDGCINITEDGTSLYGELSFDCMRIKEKGEASNNRSFDKDLWRHNKKSDLLIERYTQLVTKIKKTIGNFI